MYATGTALSNKNEGRFGGCVVSAKHWCAYEAMDHASTSDGLGKQQQALAHKEACMPVAHTHHM